MFSLSPFDQKHGVRSVRSFAVNQHAFPTYPIVLLHNKVNMTISTTQGGQVAQDALAGAQLTVLFQHEGMHMSFQLSDPADIFPLAQGFLFRSLCSYYAEYIIILRNACAIHPNGAAWRILLGVADSDELAAAKQGLDADRLLR